MFQDEFVVKFQVDLTLVLGVYDHRTSKRDLTLYLSSY